MLQETAQNCEDLDADAWRLGHLEGMFDIVSMPSAAPMHICAALPNSRALERWPDFPTAALPTSGRIANGCGLTAAASRRSAIGEAVELLKTCAWGDEPVIRATVKDLGARAIRPETLNGFSRSQIESRVQENRRLAGQDWIPASRRDDVPLDWMQAEDAQTGGLLYVPADAVLIGRRDAGDPAAVAVAESNGCACGPTVEAAKCAALMELIERDAAGRWWYGQRRRQGLDPAILGALPELCAYLSSRSRRFFLFNITTDLAVPVVAAASCEPDGTVVALGFAAKTNLTDAARAATIEMLATETSLPPWRDIGDDAVARTWVKRVCAFDLPVFADVESAVSPLPGNNTSWTLDACLATLLSRNCRVLFVDLSRRDARAPVFSAFSPELCHIRPRFGKMRLLAPDALDLEQGKAGAEMPGAWPILF